MIAPGVAEIFCANTMNNRLPMSTLPPDAVDGLMNGADGLLRKPVLIEFTAQTLRSRAVQTRFDLQPRQRRSCLAGRDNIGLSLNLGHQIDGFARTHRALQTWRHTVAALVKRAS